MSFSYQERKVEIENSNFYKKVKYILSKNRDEKYLELSSLIESQPSSFDETKVLELVESELLIYLRSENAQIFKMASLLKKKLKNSPHVGNVDFIISAYYAFNTDLTNALKYAELAKNEFVRDKNYKGEIKATFSIGAIYCNMSRYDLSNAVYFELLSNPRITKTDKGNIYFNVAINFYNSKFTHEAVKYLKLAEKNLPDSEKNRVNILLGTIYAEEKDYRSLNRTLINLESRKMTIYDRSNYLELKAVSSFNKGQFAKAINEINSSIDITVEINNIYYLPSRYLLQGLVFDSLKQTNNAIEAYKNSLKYGEMNNNSYAVYESYSRLARSYKKNGQLASAIKYFELHNILGDSLFSSDLIKEMEKSTHILQLKRREDMLAYLKEKNNWVLQGYKTKETELRQSYTMRFFILILSVVLISFLVYMIYSMKRTYRLANANLIKKYKLELVNEHLKGQEEEKAKIALELHDHVANELMALTFTENEELKANLNQIIEKIRAISHELSTPSLNEEGSLIEMTDKLIIRYLPKSKYSVYFGWFPQNLHLVFSKEFHRQTMYRILQELFVNINKHSQSDWVEINFCLHDTVLSINVTDNGVGFNAESSKAGIGLGNLNKRIVHLEGKLEIDSSSKGTTVLIEIPVKLFNT